MISYSHPSVSCFVLCLVSDWSVIGQWLLHVEVLIMMRYDQTKHCFLNIRSPPTTPSTFLVTKVQQKSFLGALLSPHMFCLKSVDIFQVDKLSEDSKLQCHDHYTATSYYLIPKQSSINGLQERDNDKEPATSIESASSSSVVVTQY